MMDMSFKNNPLYIDARKRMEREFQEKRERGVLSKAHAEDHVIAVSNFGSATAHALMKGQGYIEEAQNAALLASVAGLMHDIKREATERVPHGPEGAKYILKLSWESDLWRDIGTEGFDSIYRAIANHEQPFNIITTIFGDPLKVEDQQLMPSVVAHSLKTGDAALEASGYRVLERRAFFVGRERMFKDLKNILKYPEESHLAFLGETMIRLYKRNPIDAYPEWLKPLAQEWHAVQYLFYKGLLRYVGMNEREAAEYMHRIGFTRFDEKMVEKITSEKHLDGKHFSETEYPILSEKIREMNELEERELDDLAESSYRVIKLISEADSPESALKKYKREGIGGLKYAKEFMDGIIAYREGSEDFLDYFAHKIEDSVIKLKKARI
ncbi:MAG TPA: hypothetical protein ENG00_01330 [Candidatus Aenigmarchaeota archaeon]|nr:hypothetical protein [Candidatus Aenigmarchaeota archaeon]